MLEGKVAVVTGAAQGLGAAFATALAEAGAQVLAVDVQEQEPPSEHIRPLIADVSQRKDVERIVQTANDELGGVDVLVNNAGTWRRTPVTSSWEQAIADWHTIMDTNLKGVVMLSRLCVPVMRHRGCGDIVNVSSYYVLPARSEGTNPPDTDLYNASKWALNGLTDAWSKALAKDAIRVNGLCMGAVDTPMLRGLFADGELPEPLASQVMQPATIAQQLLDLLADGRTGENIGAWVGEPVVIPAPAEAHRRISG